MIEKLFTAARSIMPPDYDADGRMLQRWRKNVFWTLLILMLALAFHLAAAKGLLEPIGVSGVAQASEVRQNGKTARAILRRLALPEIRRKVRQRCEATTAADRERINRELDRILEQFQNDTGQPFGDLPTCGEV